MPVPLQIRAARALRVRLEQITVAGGEHILAVLPQWKQSTVRSASDQIEADVAQMDRAALIAWTMPALPEWA